MKLRIAVAALFLVGPVLAGELRLSKVDRQLLEDADAVDRQFDQRGLVFRAPALEERMAGLILAALPEIENVHWRFRILRDPMVNAFALPNGSVYVNTGLLARIENEEELTAILAHETAHVVRNHPYLANREARRKVLTAGLFAAGSAFFGWGASTFAALAVSQVGMDNILLGYKAEFEQEADRDAATLLKSHGQSSGQFIRLLRILGEPVEIEPQPAPVRHGASYDDRAGHLKESFNDAGATEPGDPIAFLESFGPAIVQNVQLDLMSRRCRSALAGAQRLVDARPEDSEYWFWLGEVYRSLGPRREKLTAVERSAQGQREAYQHAARLTEQEEFKELAATTEGGVLLSEHQANAEDCYRKAAALNPQSAKPYVGLGMLYEQQGKAEQAKDAYNRHLEMAPQSPDRARVELRLKALATGGTK